MIQWRAWIVLTCNTYFFLLKKIIIAMSSEKKGQRVSKHTWNHMMFMNISVHYSLKSTHFHKFTINSCFQMILWLMWLIEGLTDVKPKSGSSEGFRLRDERDEEKKGLGLWRRFKASEEFWVRSGRGREWKKGLVRRTRRRLRWAMVCG